jgi:phosphonate transport system substrate-binding protein
MRPSSSGHVLRKASFGCVPVSDDAGTRASLNDLCSALSDAIGLEVRPHRAPTLAALSSAFAHERIQLAWVSPVLAATDPGLAKALPIVHSVRRGMARYHGIVFARADGPKSLADLRGKKMAWVDPSSAGGYVFSRMAIAREHAAVLSSFASEQMMGSHGAVAEAVRSGIADAGATFAVFEHGDPSRALLRAGFAADDEPKDGFRVLAASESIPSDLIVASPALLQTLSIDLVAAFEALSKVEPALAAMRHVLGADSFERCAPAELDALRIKLRRASGE